MLEEERRLGVEEGIEKGKKEQQISIARNLKKAGIDIKIISENTGLSIEEIENLWVPDIRKNGGAYQWTSFLYIIKNIIKELIQSWKLLKENSLVKNQLKSV